MSERQRHLAGDVREAAMEVAHEATRVRPKRTSLTAMRQRLHAVRVRPKLLASLTAMRQRLHAVGASAPDSSVFDCDAPAAACSASALESASSIFDGDAPAVAACGASAPDSSVFRGVKGK